MLSRIDDLFSSKGKLEYIYCVTLVEVTNNFEELYLKSLKYIDNV